MKSSHDHVFPQRNQSFFPRAFCLETTRSKSYAEGRGEAKVKQQKGRAQSGRFGRGQLLLSQSIQKWKIAKVEMMHDDPKMGTFMEHSWNIHGTFMEHSWNIHGTFMEHSDK